MIAETPSPLCMAGASASGRDAERPRRGRCDLPNWGPVSVCLFENRKLPEKASVLTVDTYGCAQSVAC
jgi:hypothetical protein